jgi:hypothetical protein
MALQLLHLLSLCSRWVSCMSTVNVLVALILLALSQWIAMDIGINRRECKKGQISWTAWYLCELPSVLQPLKVNI